MTYYPATRMFRKVVLVLVVAVVLSHVGKFLTAMRVFQHVYNHVPGTCGFVEGVEQGSEDIVLISSGQAFISSGLVPQGLVLDPVYFSFVPKVFVFDYRNPSNGAKKSTSCQGVLRKTSYPTVSAYSKTHAKGHSEDRVEIFRFDANSNSLIHVKSVTHSLLYSVNDVVATGQESFYATNDKYSTGMYSKMTETWLLLSWSNVVYYNKGGATIVAGGFKCANGVNLSPDGNVVYVADSIKGVVTVFHRQRDNTLRRSHDISLHTSLDNICVDATSGDLWIGAHPKPIEFAEHLKNASHPCGSQVLRVKNPAGEAARITEVYSDDGRSGLWGSNIGWT
ncbi:serum paraoxonase/arylesterase 1-like [Branchiostoma floridae]|uniref:Paraoxonase n=1 Tax=Branchiostoma floridae TaxID=7739 RepID=A0A9J7NA50_BRAFL|nr:serum paraoxonase/arylesterase 1-like [Branchiostoma floridae]